MTDTRAAFEQHFKLCIRQAAQHKDGTYRDSSVQAKWEGYQAGAQQAAQGEPVEYQCRTRPMWFAEGAGWTDWEKCSAESYEDYGKVPVLHDWQFEVRKLYAR